MAGFTIFKYDIATETSSNITTQGVEKVVIYGIPDWVYEGTASRHLIFYDNCIILEEVLASNYAMWWAPDGEHILYAVFNDSVVRDFDFPYYGDPSNAYTDIISIAYPKVSCHINDPPHSIFLKVVLTMNLVWQLEKICQTTK